MGQQHLIKDSGRYQEIQDAHDRLSLLRACSVPAFIAPWYTSQKNISALWAMLLFGARCAEGLGQKLHGAARSPSKLGH